MQFPASKPTNKPTLVVILLLSVCAVVHAADQPPLSADAMCSLVVGSPLATVEAAIAGGGDLKTLSRNQRTALTEAVMWGASAEVIATLLKAGADPNAVGWYGRTPLMWTGWSPRCRPETVAMLQAAGADPKMLDMGGNSALLAVIGDHDRPDVITALIAAGVDVQQPDKEGWTALDRARERRRSGIIAVLLAAGARSGGSMWAILKTGTPDEVRQLVTATHLNLNAEVPADHRIPIVEALATISDPAVVRVLVELGADLHVTDLWGTTPLLRAVGSNANPGVVAELVRLGADANTPHKDSGETPLMQAVTSNDEREAIVRALLAAHADVTIKDRKGNTVLDYANDNPSGHGMEQVLRLLSAAGAPAGNGFWRIIERGDLTELRAAIACEADVNTRDQYSRTPLMIAVMHNCNATIVTTLLTAGANVNALDSNNASVLMYLVQNAEVIAPLVAAGAKVDARDSAGRTPLMHAVQNPNAAVITALLAAGADPSLLDNEGHNALEQAASNNRDDAVTLLRTLAGAKAEPIKEAPVSNF